MVCAQDMGVVVNPEGATHADGRLHHDGPGLLPHRRSPLQGRRGPRPNFDTYEIPRFSWLPKIETVLVDERLAAQGGGEPAIIGMGAVVANAIFDATGARLFQLPMTPERVMAALEKGKGK